MVRIITSGILATVTLLAASQAGAATLSGDLLAKLDTATYAMTTARYQDLYDSRSLVPETQYTGVGSLFTSFASTATDGFGSLCTGSLVSYNVVLTAAHCVSGEAGNPVTSVNFYLPSFGAAIDGDPYRNYAVSNFTISPDYTGNSYHGGDLALLTLNAPVMDREIYQIYTGNNEISTNGSQVFTRVGTGTIGTGDLGQVDQFSDYQKRYGFNEYEYTWDQVFNALDGYYGLPEGSLNATYDVRAGNLLAMDADSGLAINDVFGRFMDKASTGVMVDGEVRDTMSSFGDSGGPTFINGQIAGVASFLISGNIFEPGDCAIPGSVDPSKDFATGTRCNNASFGELAADTRVSSYAGFIQDYIAAAAVPEPSTWAMMITGFGAVAGMLRRGRRKLVPARA